MTTATAVMSLASQRSTTAESERVLGTSTWWCLRPTACAPVTKGNVSCGIVTFLGHDPTVFIFFVHALHFDFSLPECFTSAPRDFTCSFVHLPFPPLSQTHLRFCSHSIPFPTGFFEHSGTKQTKRRFYAAFIKTDQQSVSNCIYFHPFLLPFPGYTYHGHIFITFNSLFIFETDNYCSKGVNVNRTRPLASPFFFLIF